MSGHEQSTANNNNGDADGNPNRQGQATHPALDEQNNNASLYNKEKPPVPPLYWSVLHHKNLHENHTNPVQSGIPQVIHEVQPFKKDGGSRSALSGYGSTSEYTSVFPPNVPEPPSSSERGRWGTIKEVVNSKELLISHIAEGKDKEECRRWSDLSSVSYELTLRDCVLLHATLLAIGVLAYSFLFENWTVIDAIYFTTVLLTTVGYGDIAPTTPGGKLFGSIFSLGGVVVIGLALGVVGSQLVEAEIKTAEKMRSKTSKALEFAFTRKSRRRRKGKEDTAHGTETSERSLTRSCSTSSMDSMRSIDSTSTSSSVHGQESSSSNSLASKSRRHHKKEEQPKRFAWLLVVRRHIPGFAPLLIGGLAITILERWGWYDFIYYCVITGTTIGFGDLTPKSQTSKAVAILFVPIAVATMGYILGNIASFIVDRRRAEYTKKLWAGELKLEDIEALDEGRDGGVSELEYIKFMLVAMKKIDGELFDDLRDQFDRLDLTGDGQITRKDLTILATRKMKKVTHKLRLTEYKHQLERLSKHTNSHSLFDRALVAVHLPKRQSR